LRRNITISLLVGAAAGMLAGLTGVGGGVFLVPLLVGVLYLPQHEAHGTSFLIILPIAVVGTITYAAMGHMDWGLILGLAMGGVLGVLLGARLMMLLPEDRLRWLWGVFIIIVGFFLMMTRWGYPTEAATAAYAASWTSVGIAIPIGFVAGILAGMMGVGGGVVLIPGLVMILGVDQHTAQGVSLAVISFMALLGVLAHYRLENVRLRVALWVIPTAALFSFVGSFVASYLSGTFLRDFVGGVIIVVGVITVVKGWRARES
jgi:uncharacterized membrane protein YfcA